MSKPVQKENECIEVLEDGTIHYFDLNVCDEEADAALDDLFGKEGKVPNFDFTASVFTLFVNSIHILTQSGWTTEDLLNEVMNHSEADDDDDTCPDCGGPMSLHIIDDDDDDDDDKDPDENE